MYDVIRKTRNQCNVLEQKMGISGKKKRLKQTVRTKISEIYIEAYRNLRRVTNLILTL